MGASAVTSCVWRGSTDTRADSVTQNILVNFETRDLDSLRCESSEDGTVIHLIGGHGGGFGV